MSSNKSTYAYYNYLKNYNAHFLNRYESWNCYRMSRRSNFNTLLFFRSSLMTTRKVGFYNFDYKLKNPFYYFCILLVLADVYGIWFFQNIYNHYSYWKFIPYQPELNKSINKHNKVYHDVADEKYPINRLNYDKQVKIIYNGEEGQNITAKQRYRYR